jgi:hypothetical protein
MIESSFDMVENLETCSSLFSVISITLYVNIWCYVKWKSDAKTVGVNSLLQINIAHVLIPSGVAI